MLCNPITPTTFMFFPRSGSDISKFVVSNSTSLPQHAIKLLDHTDHSGPGTPAIATRVSSAPSAMSVTLKSAKLKPSALSSNAIHRKGQTGMNGGRWTEQEHQRFLAGLRLYGREWKKVAGKIKTRTSAQIRSHAQKYFAKLARDDELRKHCGLSVRIPGPADYFSDGGSIAQNSSDDDADPSDVLRQKFPGRSTCQTKGAGDITVAPMSLAVGRLYQQTLEPKNKRSRDTEASYMGQLGIDLPASTYPYKLYQRPHDALPSQEELLAKASPNLRYRLSCLIEAELCALQVLSCYAMLQQQDYVSASRHKLKFRAWFNNTFQQSHSNVAQMLMETKNVVLGQQVVLLVIRGHK
ncbi:unnamed protein product [Peronospora belbahrii]|uniref:Uncharacterized protein n=1 Tax=Peronospora belbahrii TaxID=622444 RepID=A0ABN8CYE5_9STRA|nr:unnamed protein product [Peronospora belbahrii]